MSNSYSYIQCQTETILGLRFYHTPEGSFPSITTVLSGTQSEEKMASLENWRSAVGHDNAIRITKTSTDHGTMVHLLAERFLKGEDPFAPVNGNPIAPADIGAFNALRLKLKKITKIWGQEEALFSKSLGVAGRFDCIGEYQGVPCVIDFKTSLNRIKKREDIEDYELQLQFYAYAHNELYGTDINHGVILMVAQQGIPLEFLVKFDPYHLCELKRRIAVFYQKLCDNLELG
jgi:ATP-dependent exoDNAse (exonuclease V) beta subunit